MNIVRLSIALLCAANVAACGSIVRGTDEKISFVSEPSGAVLTTSKGYGCASTPCTLDVPRSDEFDATFRKPGYRTAVIPVRTQIVGKGAAGMAGNLLAGGVVGIGVDAYTGAAYDHTPNPVVAKLVPEGGPAARPRRTPAAEASAAGAGM